jgi:hypothetical protein
MLEFVKVPCPQGLVYRAKIPGGWLVSFSDGLTFVPDPEHRWDGSSLP